jgi:hypothetical protein
MRLFVCVWCAVSLGVLGTSTAQQPRGTKQEPKIGQPLRASERSAAARLTRLRGARLWWNNENRVIGASFKGADANDHAIALASALPGLRTVVLVATPQSQLTDDGLAPLTTLPALELLSIYGNRTTDAALVHVGQMRKLRTLVLNCDVTDTGLETLSGLTNLEQLDLTQSKITDAGIVSVKNFVKLKTLILNGTRLTNESLSTIAELKTLENLYLGDTSIDDAAVASLKQMEQLQTLFLLDTPITARAVAELQPFLLETCTIIHQSGTCEGTRKSPLAMARVATQATIWRPAK